MKAIASLRSNRRTDVPVTPRHRPPTRAPQQRHLDVFVRESELSVQRLPVEADRLAPDGSEIRELSNGRRGGLCHCRLGPGQVSSPRKHRAVEELWFCSKGQGELWLGFSGGGQPIALAPGVSVHIPPRTPFQFRNTGTDALEVLITTMPRWPGPEEAQVADGPWTPNHAGPA
ncbi:MAG: cupin domain-containing protein [Deltaproteobacteria bacterium]|nr:cupin domain-containing protein [Deltaproteobacteria bacterium]